MPDGGIAGSIAEILKALESAADDGDHCVVVYPDMDSLRKIYARYSKKMVDGNEIVVLLPYYETVDKVKSVLSQHGVDARLYEVRGELLVMDSYRTYLGFQQDSDILFGRIVSHAIMSRKGGIAIMADMGAYYLIDRIADLARNIATTAGRSRLKVRGFCSYHKKDYDKLSDGQRKAIFGSGYRALVVQQTS